MANKFGYCKCGCGEKTTICSSNNATRNMVKGQPRDYIKGHANRKGSGERPLCACGCLQPVVKYQGRFRQFAKGHKNNLAKRENNYTVDPLTGCHNWLGAKTTRTGHAMYRGKFSTLVYRDLWIQKYGPIPEGKRLDHKCDNPACINTDHLRLLTSGANTRRGKSAKITYAIAQEMRHRFFTEKITKTELGRQYKLGRSQVIRILDFTCWTVEDEF